MVVEVAGTVEEARERHWGQLDELQGLHVEDHGILGTGRVIVAAEYDDLIGRDESGSLRLDRERELNWEDGPVVIRNIILLDGIYAT